MSQYTIYNVSIFASNLKNTNNQSRFSKHFSSTWIHSQQIGDGKRTINKLFRKLTGRKENQGILAQILYKKNSGRDASFPLDSREQWTMCHCCGARIRKKNDNSKRKSWFGYRDKDKWPYIQLSHMFTVDCILAHPLSPRMAKWRR